MYDNTTTAEVSMAGRVHTAKENGMHPQVSSDVEEGTHYKVLAYTDWADQFIPTVVEWANGELDSFIDPAVSRNNRREAIQQVEMEAFEANAENDRE